MRILHVTHEFPPYEFAGTAIYTYNIVRAQAEKHEVRVFSRMADPSRPAYAVIDEKRGGYDVRLLNRPELSWNPFDASYTDADAERHFCEYVDEFRPDIVHFQHLLGLSYTIIEQVRKRAIGVVMTLHDFWAMCPMGQRMCYTDNTLCEDIVFEKCGPCVFGKGWKLEEPPDSAAPTPTSPGFHDFLDHRYRFTPGLFARRPRAWLWAAGKTLQQTVGMKAELPMPEVLAKDPFAIRTERMKTALAHCDLLITPSAFLRDEFIRIFGVSPDRIIHSHNGMKFDHVVAHPKTRSDVIRFGFVGSFIPTKGVHVLVDAAKKLADLSGFRVDIFGAPNQWTRDYHDTVVAGAKGDKHIVFHGRFDNKNIGRVLADVDVLVVPSIWYENAPLTLNEAAMTETPVLASDRGGMLEFVRDNRYGRTFKLGDPDDLAREMKRLIENQADIPALAHDQVRIKQVADNAVELEGIYARILEGEPVVPAAR